MIQRVSVGQIVDAAPARVVVTRDAQGAVTEAAFDLTGLPRVDAALTGRPVAEVPNLVERLCSICPAAHHLAGTRALESLAGLEDLPPTAQAVRRLLHFGAVIAIDAVSFLSVDQAGALALKRFAKTAMAAAGSPGHFPATAIPGGVTAPADPDLVDQVAGLVDQTLRAATRLAETALAVAATPDPFTGADLALVDPLGQLDLFGQRLRAVAADGAVVLATARPGDWDDLVAEAAPGSSAPRPYLVSLGPGTGAYRVGPVAQLRVAALPTPRAASLQQAWRHHGGAAAARAIVAVHAVETIADLVGHPELVAGPTAQPWSGQWPAGIGVGWVDGARGLLVHRYAVGADGQVRRATILTPTAQNELWLGELLRTAVSDAPAGAARAGVEQAIHEADPCLPCSAAPAGTMDLVVETTTLSGTIGG